MNTKILFTDLDGTLLNREKNISAKTYDKIQEMLAAGHKFVLASGRSINSILEVIAKLGLTGEGIYATAYNGALLYDCSHRRTIAEYRVPLAEAQSLFDAAAKEGLHIHTYTDDTIVSIADDPELAFYRYYIAMPPVISSDLSKALTLPPFKLIAIHLEDRPKLEAFRKQILSVHGAVLDSTFSNPRYLEFYVKEAGKGNGLRNLCRHLQLPVENSIAAGDEENDLSMIQAAGIGVAMQNGTALVKEHADYITEHDNNHDAMVEIIDRFILN